MARKGYSRLSKRAENQSKRNLFLSILGIIVVVFFMIQVGLPLLANFAGFISSFGKDNSSNSSKDSDFVSPPILDQLDHATKDSEFTVSGQAREGQEIFVYLNGVKGDSRKTEDDGSFSFKVFLKEGENKIQAKAIENDKESDFSEEEIVWYLKEPPKLDIQSPSDGQKFEKEQRTAQIKGSTDPNVKVTVNDFFAVMEGSNFSYSLTLRDGENIIKVIATDEAGNKTEKEVRVTYSP